MTNYRQSMAQTLDLMHLRRESKILERELTDSELKRREEIAKDLDDQDFKDRYGQDWMQVKMATATKMAKAEEVEESKADKSLAAKAEKSGISLGILKQVFKRGVAAWRTGHRPGTTPTQWGHARVNSFITGGKTRTTGDKDLWAKAKGQKEEVDLEEGTWKTPSRKEYNELLKKMKKPIKAKDAVKMIGKYIGDDELQDNLDAIASRRPNEDVVPIIKKRLESGDIDLPEEVELDEDGHADVASAIRQCKTVMEDAQQIMGKLQTMNPEDSLPTWWTNKFAVASNSMNKMRDYIVNPLGEEVEIDEVGGSAFGGTIDKIQKVVDDKQATKIDGVMVDTFTASLIMNIFNKVNKQNQDKMRKMKVTQLAKAAYKLAGMKEEVEIDEAKFGDKKALAKKGAEISRVQAILKGKEKPYKKDHKKEELDEGYEGEVVKVLKKAKIASYFSNNILYVEKGDGKDAIAALKRAPNIKELPKVREEKPFREEVELDEGKMSQLHQLMKDGKSAKEIAKIMKLDLKTIKALMGEALDKEDEPKVKEIIKKLKGASQAHAGQAKDLEKAVKESAAADARRAMRRDPEMKQRGFSKDVSATDDDEKAASKNIMMQMRKAQSLKGRFDVEFQDGKKVKIPAKVAVAVQQKYNAMRRPAEKEKFQSKVAKSYKDMLNALKEGFASDAQRRAAFAQGYKAKGKKDKKESILDRIDNKLKERKNG